MLIRPATLQDQPGILEIYNESVLHSTATFDTDPRTPEKQLEWFNRHKANHPVLVAEYDGKIAGWASLSPWSDRCAYDSTVEVSVYLAPEQRGKGIGISALAAGNGSRQESRQPHGHFPHLERQPRKHPHP